MQGSVRNDDRAARVGKTKIVGGEECRRVVVMGKKGRVKTVV